MKTLALCTDVLMLKDVASGMGKPRTTHAFEVGHTFHRSPYLGAFHTCVNGLGLCGVGIPVKIVFLTLDPGFEDSEVGLNHLIGEFTPVRRFPSCEGVGVPDECCFCVMD